MATQKKSPKTWWLLGGGVVAVALTGGIIFLSRRKGKTSFPDLPPEMELPGGGAVIPPPPAGSRFPLRMNSRGQAVRNVQSALIKAFGPSILPRYGADGIWGQETETALRSKGLPTSIGESDYQKVLRFLGGRGLSGVSGQVITRKSTVVSSPSGESIRIPKGVVLGRKVGQFSGKIHFLTPDGRTLMVNARHVNIQ